MSFFLKPFQKKTQSTLSKSGKDSSRRRRASVSGKVPSPHDLDQDLTATLSDDVSMKDQSIFSVASSSRRRGLQRTNSGASRKSAKSTGSGRRKGLQRNNSSSSRRSTGRGMLDWSGSGRKTSIRRRSGITRAQENAGLAEMAELEDFFMKMAATSDGQERLRKHLMEQRRASLAM